MIKLRVTARATEERIGIVFQDSLDEIDLAVVLRNVQAELQGLSKTTKSAVAIRHLDALPSQAHIVLLDVYEPLTITLKTLNIRTSYRQRARRWEYNLPLSL